MEKCVKLFYLMIHPLPLITRKGFCFSPDRAIKCDFVNMTANMCSWHKHKLFFLALAFAGAFLLGKAVSPYD